LLCCNLLLLLPCSLQRCLQALCSWHLWLLLLLHNWQLLAAAVQERC
jgi:hypothetical protein